MICVKALSVFLFCLLLPGVMIAAPEPSNQCKVYVAVLDEDPAGLNVRKSPGGRHYRYVTRAEFFHSG